MTENQDVVTIFDVVERDESTNALSIELDSSSPRFYNTIIESLSLIGCDVSHYTTVETFLENIKFHKDAIMFSTLCGGRHSRNKRGLLPSICEAYGLRYVGADAYTQTLCFDKYLSKLFVEGTSFLIPHSILIRNEADFSKLSRWDYFPCIVKPNNEACSIGVFEELAFTCEDVKQQARTLLIDYAPVLVEEYIPGREISICIAGTAERIDILEAVELRIDGEAEFGVWGYASKRMGRGSISHSIVTAETPNIIIEDAKKLFLELGKVEVMRIDCRVNNSGYYVIELSPDCSLSKSCFIGAAFRHNGYSYPMMLQKLIDNASIF